MAPTPASPRDPITAPRVPPATPGAAPISARHELTTLREALVVRGGLSMSPRDQATAPRVVVVALGCCADVPAESGHFTTCSRRSTRVLCRRPGEVRSLHDTSSPLHPGVVAIAGRDHLVARGAVVVAPGCCADVSACSSLFTRRRRHPFARSRHRTPCHRVNMPVRPLRSPSSRRHARRSRSRPRRSPNEESSSADGNGAPLVTLRDQRGSSSRRRTAER